MTTLIAQCVMCYRTAAAQQGGRSEVLNSGILILLAAPAAVLVTLGVLAWRREVRRRAGIAKKSGSVQATVHAARQPDPHEPPARPA